MHTCKQTCIHVKQRINVKQGVYSLEGCVLNSTVSY